MCSRADRHDDHAAGGTRNAIALDLGGTTIKAAVVAADARILYRTEAPTRPERSPEQIEADLLELHARCKRWIATGGAAMDIAGEARGAPSGWHGPAQPGREVAAERGVPRPFQGRGTESWPSAEPSGHPLSPRGHGLEAHATGRAGGAPGAAARREQESRRAGEQERSVAGTAPGEIDGVPVALALPGLRTSDGLSIARSNNIPTLNGYPLIGNLRRRLGAALVVDADSRLAALADDRFGAGRGAARLIVAMVGTGIGAAVILDGRMQSEAGLGLIEIEVPAGAGSAGATVPLERLASAAALDRTVRAAARADLDHDQIRAAIETGGGEVAAALGRWSEVFAAGIDAWHRRFNLERVSIAGGLTRYGVPVLDAIHVAVRERFAAAPAPDVRLSPLGADASLIGAALAACGAFTLTQ